MFDIPKAKVITSLLSVGLSGLLLAISVSLHAQSSLQSNASVQQVSVYDCTGVKLDEVDPQSLTRAEQIALLDGALLDSVDRYASCINQVQADMASSGGGSGSGNAANGVETLSANQSEQQNDAGDGLSDETQEIELSETVTESQETSEKRSGTDLSKLGVVKPKDNDAIICKILYDAIIGEQDDTTRKGLEAQYQDYECGR